MEHSHTMDGLNDELMRNVILIPKPALDLNLFGVKVDDIATFY